MVMTRTLSFLAAPLALAGCLQSSSTPDGGADAGAQTSPGPGFEGGVADGSGAADGGPVTSTCPTPTGAGTKHSGAIAANETWTAAGSPHYLTFRVSIPQGVTLTIEPCAVVHVQGGYGIDVGGKLSAPGTPATPILIDADDPKTPWDNIRVTSPGAADLSSVTLRNGGNVADTFYPAPLIVRGDGTAQNQPVVRAVDVVIDGSAQLGAVLMSGGTFTPDSSNLTIKGSAGRALSATAGAAGGIPSGAYTGNGVDEILLLGEALAQDTTYRDLGVPYRVGDEKGNGTVLRVGNSGSAGVAPQASTLTIAAGVTMRMSAGAEILLNTPGDSSTPANGALVATGTAAKPVVFTSAAATPAAGDWVGLYFSGVPSPASKLDYVHVEYAGGASAAKSFHCSPTGTLDEAEDAAILILGGPPGGEFVTNSSILASAGYGIDRGWSGAVVDFAASNTFTQIARCSQSQPRNADGSCPASAPCN